MDVVEGFGVAFVRDESDGESFGAEAARPRHPMQVRVGILGHVVVEDDVDSLDVHAAAEQVGRHQDALLEILELLIAREALFLGHGPMDGDGGEVLVGEELGQRDASRNRLHEDDHLFCRKREKEYASGCAKLLYIILVYKGSDQIDQRFD